MYARNDVAPARSRVAAEISIPAIAAFLLPPKPSLAEQLFVRHSSPAPSRVQKEYSLSTSLPALGFFRWSVQLRVHCSAGLRPAWAPMELVIQNGLDLTAGEVLLRKPLDHFLVLIGGLLGNGSALGNRRWVVVSVLDQSYDDRRVRGRILPNGVPMGHTTCSSGATFAVIGWIEVYVVTRNGIPVRATSEDVLHD